MKSAYLVIDMSNDFLHENGSLSVGEPGRKIVPSIIRRAKEFLDAGDLVIICMDNHKETDDHFKLWPPHNITGTWGAQA